MLTNRGTVTRCIGWNWQNYEFSIVIDIHWGWVFRDQDTGNREIVIENYPTRLTVILSSEISRRKQDHTDHDGRRPT